MGDGSLQKDKKSMVLHTQCWSQELNECLSSELNEKFNLNTRVIPHKNKYHVIFIPSKDNIKLHNLINEHMLKPLFEYKIPKLK